MNFKLNFNDQCIKHTKTDFVIVSQSGKEIPCHKFVLAARSPVFDAMFEMKDTIEVSNGHMNIPDASEKALNAMVEFLYTNEYPEDIYEVSQKDDVGDQVDCEILQELLVLSNKYDLKCLSKILLPSFIKRIDGDNCIEAYAFGIVHEYEKLKTAAFSIIVFNWDLLLEEKSRLKTFSKFHPKECKSLRKEIAEFDYDGCKENSVNSDYEDNSDDDEDTDDEVSIDINNCIDAYAYGFRKNHENLKMSAFDLIRYNNRSQILLKKMSVTHPKEHNDYQNQNKAKSETESKTEAMPDFYQTKNISPELAAIIGKKKASLAECQRGLFIYLKKNNLQDPENEHFIIPDRKLAMIYGNDKIHLKGLTNYLSGHMS